MELDLIHKIKEFKPTESYILTFSLDLHYYETFLLPLLQQNECIKNVVIADSNKVNENFETNPYFLNKIGREYILLSIYARFAFHPKVYIFKKTTKEITEILCFVGSGNLTYPGLNTNQEVFFEESWDGKGKASHVFQDILGYFTAILDSCRGESVKLARNWLDNGYPQVFEKETESSPSLLSYPNKDAIFDQFRSRIRKKQIRNLFLTAPFYDNDLSALKNVITECKPKKIDILLQPGKTDIATGRLVSFIKANSNIILKAFKAKDHANRYLHAKMIIATVDDGEYAMVGSANISDVALFGNAKVHNYEANIYQFNPARKSILEALDIEKISEPLSLDKIPDEPIEKIVAKSKAASSLEIISAECYGGLARFVVYGTEKQKALNAELLFSDSNKKTVSLQKEKSSQDIFICNEKDIFGALSARIIEKKDIFSKWIPLLFVGEIDRRSKKHFSKTERFKDSFMRAANELVRDNYLDLIIDSLIDDSLKIIETRTKVPKVVTKKDDSINGRATIDIQTEAPIIKKRLIIDLENSFTEGLDYVISALRERRTAGSIEEDVTNAEEEDKDFEEYDDKIQEVKEEKEEEEIDILLYAISRRLKARRRVFLKNESIQSPLARASYFSLISLPHIPKLHRFYIGDDKEKHLCIEDKDWDQFIVESCVSIGRNVFRAKAKTIWPDLGVDSLKKEIFEVCICSILYSCATIYPEIKYRIPSLGDEGFDNSLLINRLLTLSSALISNYLNISGATLEILKNKLDEMRDHFPCAWLHIERSISEVWDGVLFLLKNDFKKPIAWNYGELIFSSREGLVLNTKGKRVVLWL